MRDFSIVCLCLFFLGGKAFHSLNAEGQGTRYPHKPEAFFPELAPVLSNLDEKAPYLIEQRELVRQAGSQRMIADSSRGFKFGVNAQVQSIHEDRPSQDFHHRYRALGSIYLTKPLYHWGALDAASKVAELSEKSSKIRHASLLRSYRSKVRSDYLDMIILRYEGELAETSYGLALENEQDLVRRQDLGHVSDLTVYEGTLARLKQSIKLSELRRKVYHQSRVFLMETGYSTKLTFAKTAAFTNFCENHSFSGSVPVLVSQLSSPEVESLRNEIEVETNKIKIAEADLKPKLNLIGSVYQDQVALASNRDTLTRNNLLVGVEAKWDVWDSSLSRGKKEAARSRKRMNELSLQRSSARLRLAIEDLRNQMVGLEGEINANRQLVKVAGNRYDKSLIEFRQNRITPTLHFESRLTLDESKLDLAKSVSRYLKLRDLYDERTTFTSN